MAKNILVVANDISFVKSYLSFLDNESGANVLSTQLYYPDDTRDIVCSWKTPDADIESCFIRNELKDDKYNVLFMPFAGFAHLLMKDRYEDNTNDTYGIVCVKEAVNTPLLPRMLYHLYLDMKYKPRMKDMESMFIDEGNCLLEEEFDELVDLIKTMNLTMLSDGVKKLM